MTICSSLNQVRLWEPIRAWFSPYIHSPRVSWHATKSRCWTHRFTRGPTLTYISPHFCFFFLATSSLSKTASVNIHYLAQASLDRHHRVFISFCISGGETQGRWTFRVSGIRESWQWFSSLMFGNSRSDVVGSRSLQKDAGGQQQRRGRTTTPTRTSPSGQALGEFSRNTRPCQIYL